MTNKSLNRRQVRWMQRLSNYDINIQYRPGKEGGKPDALTRREGDRPDKKEKRQEEILLPKEIYFRNSSTIDMVVTSTTETNNNIQHHTLKDAVIGRIRKALQNGQNEIPGIALG